MFLKGAPGVDASGLGDGSLLIEDPHSVSIRGESEFAEIQSTYGEIVFWILTIGSYSLPGQ